MRKKPDCIVRMALYWNPQGLRSRGRPKNTWSRKVLQELRLNDLTRENTKATAENRVRWRYFVEAICSLERGNGKKNITNRKNNKQSKKLICC